MFKKIILLILLLIGFKLKACNHCLHPSIENKWINGRSSEFAPPMSTQVVIQHRGEQVQSLAPEGTAGLLWESKYGYVGISCITTGMIVDGMNEKGLSFGGLWVPESNYQKVPKEKSSQALAVELLGKWILGNFATIDQVQEALTRVYIWEGLPMPTIDVPSLYVSLNDAQGKSMVLEFVEGELKISNKE
jgi:choloylglycine hydrolase